MKKQVIDVQGEVFELLGGYVDEHGTIHKEFEIKEITGLEEELISKPDIKQNGGKVIRTLLENCCLRIGTLTRKELGLTKWREVIQKLTVADQDVILLRLREISVGKELETQHKCPHCSQDITTILDTDELEVIPFNGFRAIDFELPRGYRDKDGNVLKCGKIRMPNGLDREILDPVARKNQGQANTMLLTRCVTELEETQVYDELIRSLSIKDREHLFKQLDENKYGINLKTEVDCPHCGESFTASLNIVNFI